MHFQSILAATEAMLHAVGLHIYHFPFHSFSGLEITVGQSLVIMMGKLVLDLLYPVSDSMLLE